MLDSRGRGRSIAVIGLGVAIVGVHNALIVAGIGEAATVAVNVAFTAALVVAAAGAGVSPAAIGVRFRLRTGVTVAAVIAVAGLMLIPLPDAWFRVLIGIPIGTALCEEIMFRGALLAAGAPERRGPGGAGVADRRPATIGVSVLFGLWHVAAEVQRTGAPGLAVVPGVVATAAASAFVLCPLRRRTGSLTAPVALHAAVNVGVFLLVGLTAT